MGCQHIAPSVTCATAYLLLRCEIIGNVEHLTYLVYILALYHIDYSLASDVTEIDQIQ